MKNACGFYEVCLGHLEKLRSLCVAGWDLALAVGGPITNVAQKAFAIDTNELKDIATTEEALSLGMALTIMTVSTAELRKVADQYPTFLSDDDNTRFTAIRKTALTAVGVIAIYDVLHVQKADDQPEVAKVVYDTVVGRKMKVLALFLSALKNIALPIEAEAAG